MMSLFRRWRDARPLVRAEVLATTWEVFSVLLFSSAVVPAAFDTPWPSTFFVGSLGLSSALSGWFCQRGRRGFLLAGLLRLFWWPLIIATFVGGSDVPTLVTSLGFGLMAAAARRAIYRRELEPMPDDPSPVRLRSDLRTQLAENAAVAGIVGGHVMLLFSVAFLRTASQVVFRAWWEFIPALAGVGTIVFTLAVRPATERLLAALRAGPQGDPVLHARALDQARRLPRMLWGLNFGLWLGCIVISIAYYRTPSSWSRLGDAVMQLGFGGLFAWGVSSYQRGWHEDTVRPIVRRLERWTGTVDEPVAIDLRRRLLVEFGLPLLFTLTLSLLATIGLYRALGTDSNLREDFNAISALCASFAMLVLAVGGMFLRAARQLSDPLAKLEAAADRVARGELDQEVPPVAGPLEVRGLGRSIERMRTALALTIAELKEERAGLETHVQLRTAELRHALDELKQAQTALVQGERMALIGELVAGVAHEVYNPLNAIVGCTTPLARVREELAEMLAHYERALPDLPPARRAELEAHAEALDIEGALDDLQGILRVVTSASSRSVEIVGNLKSFSRKPVEAVPTDVNAGLTETMSLLRHRLHHRGIALSFAADPDLPPIVCRGGEINQVFMNLLTNAIQAVDEAHPEGERGRIEVRTERSGDRVKVAIEDNGPGVPAALRDRIFDPFFTTKLEGLGTGLGLSISSDIMRRHGGRLSVAEGALGGARFTCDLPLFPPAVRSRPSRQSAIDAPDAAAQ
ncbi:MAG: ATP-binding protein [Myxococcota bacterium]